MLSRKEKDRIVVTDVSDFDPKRIAESGQLFRYRETDGVYEIFAGNFRSVLKRGNACAIIETDQVDYFENFFDLSTDYSEIRRNLARFGIEDAIGFGKGLRVLRGEPWETLASFLVSQNNNIPRIRGILERLSERYGDRLDGYFGFPSAEKIARTTEAELRNLGLGYRAPFLIGTARAVADGFGLDFRGVPTEEARSRLRTLPGVGRKVADCVLLYGYGRSEVFPVDVWVERIYRDRIGDGAKNRERMAETLGGRFGALSGYAEQYLFYYYRNKVTESMTEEILS